MTSRSEFHFFGLTPEYRVHLFSQIHEIVFHGGGYDYITVYNMPVWLRNFTFMKLKEYYEKETEASEQIGPAIPSNPSYTTRARR